LWTWHLGAGLVVFVLLGLHMTIMHLHVIVGIFNPVADKAPIDWANVAARGKSLFFLVNYVVLLGAALFHGFYGLRNILFELHPGPTVKKTLSGLLVVAGVALFIVGTWAAWASFQISRGVA
jgi:succinate dehydrogenase / fumarate reductase membrane anchor subunit